jgi:hypothetical protein
MVSGILLLVQLEQAPFYAAYAEESLKGAGGIAAVATAARAAGLIGRFG